MRGEYPVLLGCGEAGVERQDLCVWQRQVGECVGGIADLARLRMAGIMQSGGDTEGARTILVKLVDGLSAGDSVYFLAVERLAYIQESKGEIDVAIATPADGPSLGVAPSGTWT